MPSAAAPEILSRLGPGIMNNPADLQRSDETPREIQLQPGLEHRGPLFGQAS